MKPMTDVMKYIDENELVGLWHLSRTALALSRATAYDRMMWTSREYNRLHPQFTTTAVYKAIERLRLTQFMR